MKKNYFLLTAGCILQAAAQPISFTSVNLQTSLYNSCTVDMNGDFLDDIVIISPNNLRIYTQLPEGGFSQIDYNVPGLGLGFVTPDWSIAAGDFDANGYNDLVLGNSSRVSLVRANDNGTGYSIISYPQNIFTQRTNFVDINNDGHLDLFACHDVAQSHVYRNDGEGNLIYDVSLLPTSSVGGNYASIFTDYNNDGLVDLYLSKCRGGAPPNDPQRINLLYENNGDGTFTEVGAAAGVNDFYQSWSTAVADFDNDGDMDFLVSNISDQNKLYRNNGDGTFTDIYASSGIAPQVGSWEILAADFNNDGWIDFLWQNAQRLYLNNGNMTFTGYNVPVSQGGIADLNNDGFLDVELGGTVFYNSGNENNWIKFNLQGVDSNRNGIGARLELYGSWGMQIREIRSGEGFAHMNSLNGHFGIGTASEIEKAIIRWPSGTVDVIPNPQVNSTVFVLEGSFPDLGLTENHRIKPRLFPNPAQEVIQIIADDTEFLSAEVYDIHGRWISHESVSGNSIRVECFEAGNYFVKLLTSEGRTFTARFVKQ